MTVNKWASALAKAEGKKSQARIGDIRELLKLQIQMQVEAAKKLEAGPLDALSEAVAKKLAKWE